MAKKPFFNFIMLIKQKIILNSILLSTTVFILDFISKYFIKNNKITYQSKTLGIIQHFNHGSIANIPIPINLISIASILALIILIIIFIQEIKSQNKIEAYTLSILISGALGNLIDRLIHQYVFDWILIFNISIINIADIAITIGAIGYLYLKIKKDT